MRDQSARYVWPSSEKADPPLYYSFFRFLLHLLRNDGDVKNAHRLPEGIECVYIAVAAKEHGGRIPLLEEKKKLPATTRTALYSLCK